jgi:hypothetical protein
MLAYSNNLKFVSCQMVKIIIMYIAFEVLMAVIMKL